jgi:hypothetical protein
MNTLSIKSIVRLIIFLVIQVLILKRAYVNADLLRHIHLMLIPLGILLFPLTTNRIGLLIIAFVTGLICDLFYDSPGVFMVSLVMIGYIRHFLFKALEPRGGYGNTVYPLPADMGNQWSISFYSLGLVVFLLTYFSMVAFSPVFIGSILLKTLLSGLGSMVLWLVYITVFSPKE